MFKKYYVYMMCNKTNTVLYTGVTNSLERRVWEHKNKVKPESFTSRYNLNKLVYYEVFSDVKNAIAREKQIKSWKRVNKNDLVNKDNNTWNDLAIDWY